MIYITGDKHGDYRDVFDFCYKNKTSKDDIMIILGDAGINYHLDYRDYILKNSLLQLPITLLCIHGNHEERPENVDGYKTKIAPVPQGKEVEVDMLVPNPKTNYNWALKKVNESEEYDYLAYRIEG